MDNGALVIVPEMAGQLAAIVRARARRDHLVIETVGRNKLLPSPGTGEDLVVLLEGLVAPALGLAELRLESRPDLAPYYDDDLGFAEYTAEVEDKVWPETLTPKKKWVQLRRGSSQP